ncbi:hypothetical protein RvY_11558 [Ramazzottius varieornatus]|uniref:Actin-related protein 10 n=1 Tax=Ramazzottius varieornatus TaxID=947166 RepID=A0A1D1VIX5_RAMVA|nr:hypothetical protein RvY_11558 [Ramazzottius varieornatus]
MAAATPPRFAVQRSPVILEMGSKFIKVGFAGDPSPLAIIPSVGKLPGGKLVSLMNESITPAERLEMFTMFLSDVYFKVLQTNAKDRKIFVLLNLFDTHSLQKTLMSVLITALEVPAVCFVSPHMTIFPSIGPLHTGLIVDIGSVTRLIPVSHNSSIVGAWDLLPGMGFAGLVKHFKDILPNGSQVTSAKLQAGDDHSDNFEDSLNSSLRSEATPESSRSEDLIQELNVSDVCLELINRWLACTTFSRSKRLLAGEKYGPDFPPFPDIPLRFNTVDGTKSYELCLTGRQLEETMEVFFQPNIDGETLPSAILKVILKCPIDLRRAMMENIIVVGGMAAVKNFIPRINSELYAMVKEAEFAEKFQNPTFRFVSTGKVPPNIVAWRGCSILVHADYFPDNASFSRDDYLLRASPHNVSNLLKEWCYVGKDRRISR